MSSEGKYYFLSMTMNLRSALWEEMALVGVPH